MPKKRALFSQIEEVFSIERPAIFIRFSDSCVGVSPLAKGLIIPKLNTVSLLVDLKIYLLWDVFLKIVSADMVSMVPSVSVALLS